MIYLFGKGKEVSIIYDDTTLSEQDKQGGIAVKQLPPEDKRDGYISVLCLDETNKPYWEYVKVEKEEE
jgi:hypothetical protein